MRNSIPVNPKIAPRKRGSLRVLALGLVVGLLVMIGLAIMPGKPTRVSAQKRTEAPQAVIYDNGPLATGGTSRSGVAAPAGFQWSEASFDYGSTTVTNTLAGVGCQKIGVATLNRCADDFNVPVGQTWTVNTVTTYAYLTGSVTAPVTSANCQIWQGRPGDPGSVVVAGNTTGLTFTTVDSTLLRIFNSGPPLNTATGTTRKIWATTMTLPSPVVLTAGNYWIDFQTECAASGNFTPPVSITGTRGVPGWTARQFIGPPTNTGWADSFDDGNPVTADNITQEFPFKLDGSIAIVGPNNTPTSRTMDFDGDNKSDPTVVRSTGAAAQAEWYTLKSSGGSSSALFGTGVGFAGGDIATPEDFDGDGKTDIAVWRTDPTVAKFYILQSATNTVRTEQFGKAGDDPTVIGDYDGDGKGDVAVFRGTVGAGDPCGASSVWYWRPSGTPATNFSYSCWGSPGDKPFPGDFDGDKKYDFSVVRNSGGAGAISQSRTAAGPRYLTFGNFTDNYIGGDFDADGRNDIALVRAAGGLWQWYFISSGNGQLFFFTRGASTTDYVVPGDYDGDNKTDFGLWRSGAGAGSGDFLLLKTLTSPTEFKWGNSGGNLTAPDYPAASYQVH